MTPKQQEAWAKFRADNPPDTGMSLEDMCKSLPDSACVPIADTEWGKYTGDDDEND